MCGLVAIFGSVPDDRPLLAADLIRHRGPDGMGIWRSTDNTVVLAHTRLAIVDLSANGEQPMLDDSGRTVIVYNGELYGYQPLRRELEDKGHVFRGHSDTEVLLRLYIDQGPSMLRRLNGIFSFVIWDAQAGRALVARDPLGIKPLYWMPLEAGGVAFASEIKALLQVRFSPIGIDGQVVRDYLSYLWSPQLRTIASPIEKFPAGSYVWVNAAGAFSDLPTKYARWPHQAVGPSHHPGGVRPAEHIGSVGEAVAAVRKSLAAAVERQLVADVPVGAFLSGGLDSSAVVAMARQSIGDGRKVQCFTIDFEDDAGATAEFKKDLPYARKVAAHLGVDLHEVRVSPDIAAELPRMIYHLDEPLADPAPLNVLLISELAKRHGIKVLLSGAGGDDLFTGYRRHYALTQERWWSWLPAGARKLVAQRARAQSPHFNLVRRIAKALQFADLDGDRRIASYFRWMDPRQVENLLHPALRTAEPRDQLQASLDEADPRASALRKMLYLECRHFLSDHNLLYTDKMSMAVGVEVRVPLLDPELIELAESLPMNYLQRGRQGKWILKKAMEGILPDEVIYRAKTGFGLPLRTWLRGPLHELVDQTLSVDSIRRRGIFDAESVHKLIAADRDRIIDATYPIFALLCIELWCKIFMDRWGPGSRLRPLQ